MELQDNFAEIYQFTIVLTFGIALAFFAYMYYYSIALQKSIKEKEKTKQQLLKNEIALMKTELEKEQLENERRKRNEKNLLLEQEVLLRNKELTTSTLLINQHTFVLKKINTHLDEIKSNTPNKKNAVRDIKKLIRASINLENDWVDFKLHFENVHPDFFVTLGKLHPNLTQTDNRHCAYMRMKLNTKEIARLLNISPTSVQMARVRLKKKMHLGKEIDLRNHILNI